MHLAAESCIAKTMQKLYHLFSVCMVIFHTETTGIYLFLQAGISFLLHAPLLQAAA